MFERFTTEARRVVVDAQREARGLGHTWIGTEHLLLAALDDHGSPVQAALAELGVTYAGVRRQVVDELSGPSGDKEALRDLGIDLEEVRRRVEASFGPGALDDPCRHRHRHRRWSGRRRQSAAVRHLPFTRRAKLSLRLAVGEAVDLGSREITAAHVVLATMRSGGLAAGAVATRGVTPEGVRRAVLDRMGRAA